MNKLVKHYSLGQRNAMAIYALPDRISVIKLVMRKPGEKITLERKKDFLEQYRPWPDELLEGAKMDEFALAIGRFLISFSKVEMAIDDLFVNFVNSRGDEPGFRIIKFLNFRTKLDITEQEFSRYVFVVEKENTKKQEIIKEVFGKVREISEFRNKVAHANWATLDKKGFVQVDIKEISGGEGIYFESIKMSPGVIRKFIRQSEAIDRRLENFGESIMSN